MGFGEPRALFMVKPFCLGVFIRRDSADKDGGHYNRARLQQHGGQLTWFTNASWSTKKATRAMSTRVAMRTLGARGTPKGCKGSGFEAQTVYNPPVSVGYLQEPMSNLPERPTLPANGISPERTGLHKMYFAIDLTD